MRIRRAPNIKGRYRSGQTGRTVNSLAYAFSGSNPDLPTPPFLPVFNRFLWVGCALIDQSKPDSSVNFPIKFHNDLKSSSSNSNSRTDHSHDEVRSLCYSSGVIIIHSSVSKRFTSGRIAFCNGQRVRLLAVLFLVVGLVATSARAANVVTIGDSLTAEYDTIPDVPNFINLPTDYAKVTVPGWVSMSWVEVMHRMRPQYFNFGGYKVLPKMWSVPQMSGFEYNWGIPGVTSGQYREFVMATPWSKPAFFAARLPLEEQLANTANRVVIWLGGNDFRATYGTIYDGGSSTALISGIKSNLSRIINFVRQRNPKAQIVIVNVPDLGATPAKKAAHPDPLKRANVTAATQAANQLIASLAAKQGIPVANAYGQTANLIKGVHYYFGAVEIVNDMEADNNPRYAFTRDGLHPNTASQIRNARAIISAFNAGYNAGIPQITDAEALALLRINRNQPYYDWLAENDITNKSFIDDAEGDGIPQFVEYALGLNPTAPDADQLPVTLGGPVAGYSGNMSVQCTPDPTRRRMARVRVQYSTDLVTWHGVPATNVITKAAGAFTAVVPPTSKKAYVRLKVSTIPPSGSTVSVYAVLRLN